MYTKEDIPWFDQVSEDKPVYVLTHTEDILKVTSKAGALPFKPLTEEQVNDIVETIVCWNLRMGQPDT